MKKLETKNAANERPYFTPFVTANGFEVDLSNLIASCIFGGKP